MIKGKQSIAFENPPYILSAASIVGQKEGEGPLGNYFDKVEPDPQLGKDTWEEAESELQKQAAQMALQKAGLTQQDIRYLFCGDLLGQIIASSFGMLELQIPMFGLYGACSTAGESLSLAAMTVAAGYASHCLAVTSSHFASAEKQFRYPLEYASQRPLSTTWTVTGSGAFIVSTEGYVKITGITTGKMMDYGIKDSMNMGAAMAPAAADTIFQHFKDFDRTSNDYDLIVTGDLGVVGRELVLDLLKQIFSEIKAKQMVWTLLIWFQLLVIKQLTESLREFSIKSLISLLDSMVKQWASLIDLCLFRVQDFSVLLSKLLRLTFLLQPLVTKRKAIKSK